MTKAYFILFLIGLLGSCSESTEMVPEENDVVVTEQEDTPKYSAKINFIEGTGWGYQIFEGSKLIVNQEHIPAVPGMQGFETEEHARITADYILEKLNNGIFPPTVSPEELDSLGVI